MSWFKRLCHGTARHCWRSTLILAVIIAVFLVLARGVTHYAQDHREALTDWVSEYINKPIHVEGFEIEWARNSPWLILTDVKLLSDDRSRPVLAFDQARIQISLLDSLFSGRIVFGMVALAGADFALERTHEGRIQIRGLTTEKPQTGVEPPADDDVNELQNWLLGFRNIHIESANVFFHDDMRDSKEWHFPDVSFQLYNEGDLHRLAGEILLPQRMGDKLKFAAEVEGDFGSAGQWRAKSYISAVNLRLAPVIEAIGDAAGVRVQRGVATFDLWSAWYEGRLDRIQGLLDLKDMRFALKDKVSSGFEFKALSGDIILARTHKGWDFDAERFTLQRKDHVWPSSRLHVSYAGDEKRKRINAGATYLDLGDVAIALSNLNFFEQEQVALLERLAIEGEVREFHVDWLDDASAEPRQRFDVQGEFNKLGWRAVKKAPGFAGMAGQFAVSEEGGSVAVDTSSLSLDYLKLFSESLSFDQAHAHAVWRNLPDQLAVQVTGIDLRNADGQVAAAVDVRVPKDKSISPHLWLNAVGERLNIERLAKYLPVHIMHQDLVSWLKRSLVSGEVSRLGFKVNGPTRTFPFRDGKHQFHAGFQAEDVLLDYSKDWPKISGIDLSGVFTGDSMQLYSDEGRLFESDLKETFVEIKTFKKPVALSVKSQIEGPADNILSYLRQSPPLNEMLGQGIAPLKAKGGMSLDLDLGLTFAKKLDVDVDTAVKMKNTRLLIGEGYADLSHLQGELGFSTKQGFSGKKLTGKVLGQKARFDVKTRRDKAGRLVSSRFVAKGDKMDMSYTLDRLVDVFSPYFEGHTSWQAVLNVPLDERSQGYQKDVSLTFNTDLKGVEVLLPKPFDKGKSTERNLSVAMALPLAENRPIKIAYGDLARAAMSLKTEGDKFAFSRGEVRFGVEEADLPPDEGLRLLGHLTYFDLAEWQALSVSPPQSDSQKQQDAHGNQDVGALDLISSGWVLVDQVVLFGQKMHHFDVRMQRDEDYWYLHSQAHEMAGRIAIPRRDKNLDSRVDLEYLLWQPVPENDKPNVEGGNTFADRIDPRTLSGAKIRIKYLSYDGMEIGDVELHSQRRDYGLEATSIRAVSPHLKVVGKGQWMVQADGSQLTYIDLELITKDIGRMLPEFGYEPFVKGGEGKAQVNVQWSGEPADFALEKLNGTFKLSAKEGHLLEVEPGAGRLVGLISFQTIPRRLILDFRDVFTKGFAFDKAGGDFALFEGSAYTSNFSIDGPAADVLITGRTDYMTQTYDQKIVMMPQVSEGLPLVAVLIQPELAPIVWALQKLLGKKINKVAMAEYKLTGSWEKPNFERIERKE